MKIGQGVESSIHCCALLAALPEGACLPLEKIAEYYELPVPYLRKHFQAMSKAGIVHAVSGPQGGYRLAKSPKKISVLDIFTAVEGDERAFRCAEIRQSGPNACKNKKMYAMPCNIATTMWRAEAAWRDVLAKTSIAQIVEDAQALIPEATKQASLVWLGKALGTQ
jgi:Rrf2 family protein